MAVSAGAGLASESQARYAFIKRELRKRLVPPASVVELGAAPGDQIAQLAQEGYNTTAVDIGIASDAWAKSEDGRMLELFARDGVEYVEWNLEEVPYPLADDSFDAVIMTEVFEHLRDYPIRSLEECHRVLKDDGLLFFTTPNVAYLMNRIRLLLGRNIASSLSDWIAGVPFARHAREYTFSEVRELLHYAGFTTELMTSRHFHIDMGATSLPAQLAKTAIDRIAQHRPTLGPLVIAVARKEGGSS